MGQDKDKKKESKAKKSKFEKKKHSHKKDKSEKKSKKEKKEKKEKKHSSRRDEGNPEASTKQIGDIDIDDYFLKNEHFRIWCALIKKTSFESLSSDDARALFTNDFCRSYNRHNLPETFYQEEMPVEMREAALKTKHHWNFRVTGAEAESIQQVADDVDFKTRHASEGAWTHMKPRDAHVPSSSSNHKAAISAGYVSSNMQGMFSSSSHSKREEDDSRDLKRNKQTHEKHQFREYSGVIMDELAPKESGRAAQIDKRRGVGAELKAAAREREDARDGLDLPESVVMGGGDDFEAARARISKGKSARDTQRAERLSELQEREQQKQATFMAQLGVDLSRGPIKIAPRE